MIQEAITDQSNRYLDFCAFRFIYNKRDSFFLLCLKNYEFVTGSRDIIRSKKVGTI